MEPKNRAIIELHIAVFLFGFTAILGALIEMSSLLMVWWRLIFTCVSLMFIANISRIRTEMSRKTLLKLVYYGVIICLHWLAFYAAIKESSASVALIGLATASFWASIIEPIKDKKSPSLLELGLGLLIIPGMMLIAGSIEKGMWLGLGLGILSAILSALFSVLNRQVVKDHNAFDISLVELTGALVFLTFFLPLAVQAKDYYGFLPKISDLAYLLVLALVCTTLAYVLSLRSLKYLSAFTVTLTVNLEPIYGILLAFVLLGEKEALSARFLAGGTLIFMAVLFYPTLQKRLGR